MNVDCAAQSCPKIVFERSDRERGIELIKKILDLKRARGAGEKAEAERPK